MKLTELQERIRQIHALLSDPQEGLMSWNMALGKRMNALCETWNATNRQQRLKQHRHTVSNNES